jgi:hypothetical protein
MKSHKKTHKKIYKKTTLFGTLLLSGLMLVACDASTGTVGGVGPKAAASVAKAAPEIVMYKSPSCECCTGWAEHLRQAGFTVTVNKHEDMDAIKAKYGVPENLASCHTAIVDGYVIEGHVPAADVVRLLKERPEVTGLTAPGMPMQSPGMQAEGLQPENYSVLSFDKNGSSRVFTRY